MKKVKKSAILLLAVICFACVAFAFGCSQSKKYYTVTFMNGQTQIGEGLKVEKGKRIEQFPYVEPATEYDYLDGWCIDEELSKHWNNDIERVTKDVTLYAKFLHITQEPNNPFMVADSFSNTLCWLQRGEIGSTYSVELYAGEKISLNDYGYAATPCYLETDCPLTVENYKGERDIYKVSWTAAEKPLGGVYAAKVICGESEVTFGNLLYKGAGTAENPFLIADGADFAAINTVNVSAGRYYKLLNDITVRTASSKVNGFTFDGELDGNGKKITVEASDCGLFSTLGKNAVVTDLAADGAIPGVSSDCAGVICAENNGSISFCNISATVTGELGTIGKLEILEKGIKGGIGGIAGINNGKIENCSFGGTVQASVGAGGIAAVNYGRIENCINGGTIGAGNANETGSSTKKYSYMGGIAAVNYGTVSKCATTGSGKLLAQRSESGDSTNNNVGGITAYNAAGATVTECWFDGIRVHGNKNVGGIAGENAGSISYCFAAGVYKSGSKQHSYVGGYSNVGGIAGLTNGGTVENCYVTANVYAYGSAAYSLAQTSENCVYINGNLDIKESVAPIPPQANVNVPVEVTDGDRAEFAAKSYELDLTEELLELLNGSGGEKFSGNARLLCEGFSTVQVHTLTVKVHGATVQTYEISNTSNSAVPLGKNNAPEKAGYYLAGWALKENGEIVFGTKAAGYGEFDKLGLSELNLYPVYVEGEDPLDKVLDVAVYARYVEEDIIKALIAEFEIYCAENGIEISAFNYSMIGNSKTGVADFCSGVTLGDFNVMFGQRASLTITVIGNKDTQLSVDGSARRIAKLSAGTASDAFYDFVLNEDRAKKILNPSYITSADAAKIEITLINGQTQYGEKLYVSNATENPLKAELPALKQDGLTFAGWAVTEQEVDGEKLFGGEIGYADIESLSSGGKITLYPRFTEEIVLKVAVYKKFIGQPVADKLNTEFAKYCRENGINYTQLQVDLITDGNGAAFTADAAGYDVVLGHKGGTSFVAKQSETVAMMLNAANGGKVASDRKAERLTDKEIALLFMQFLTTEAGKAALVAAE